MSNPKELDYDERQRLHGLFLMKSVASGGGKRSSKGQPSSASKYGVCSIKHVQYPPKDGIVVVKYREGKEYRCKVCDRNGAYENGWLDPVLNPKLHADRMALLERKESKEL